MSDEYIKKVSKYVKQEKRAGVAHTVCWIHQNVFAS